jgi:hypothetical protein
VSTATGGPGEGPGRRGADVSLCRSVAFKVYDMDRDGFISNGELFLVLKMMVGNNLKVRLPCVVFVSRSPAHPVFVLVGPTIAADCGQEYVLVI